MIGADRHQPGKLPLRAGIGLQRDGRQSRNPAQSLFQLTEYLLIARRLLGANGCIRENSGQVTGIISEAAFSFIVQEPSGIIEVSRPTSFRSRLRM